jgi:PAS domain S-box-containing protein
VPTVLKIPYGQIAGSGLVLLGLYSASLYSYLLFHNLVEFFSIAVAVGTFMIVWNSRRHLNNDFFLLIGISFLFVGILDLIHTLAYKGMGVFPGIDANPPTQLWIAARYVQGISFVGAVLLIGRRPFSASRFGIPLVLAGYAAILVAILAAVFIFRIFPDCYIEGTGLTLFKKASEYAICLLLAFALAVLLRHRADFDRHLLNLLTASILFTILSELSFTRYVSVYGFSNFLGHILKIFAMFFVYTAVIEIGLSRPFALLLKSVKDSEALLRQSERLFRTVADFTYDWEYWVDHEGRMRYVTPSCERITGYSPEEFVNYRRLHRKLVHPDDLGAFQEHIDSHLYRHQAAAIDFRIVTRGGELRWIGHICQPVFDETGRFIGRRASNRDITEAKELERELREALSRVKLLSGFLPICASCKKIRDDSGYWRQIEAYISEHSEAEFSHGICPECARKLYPELHED